MEIHKPKPVRDWREFLSEMLVIVLGILIALSGEQLIETLQWRHEVRETETRLGRELGANAAVAMLRLPTAIHHGPYLGPVFAALVALFGIALLVILNVFTA